MSANHIVIQNTWGGKEKKKKKTRSLPFYPLILQCSEW